jgi:hypothetical protein
MDQDRQGVKLIGVVKVGVADHLRLQCYSSCLFLPPSLNIDCRTGTERAHFWRTQESRLRSQNNSPLPDLVEERERALKHARFCILFMDGWKVPVLS